MEPENRLVARELERRWEAELKEQRQLEAEYEQFRRTQPLELSAEERARILALARDLPAIWHATCGYQVVVLSAQVCEPEQSDWIERE